MEQYTDAERVILADAYQALLQPGHSPTPAHGLRSIGYQVSDVIVAQAADVIRT